ncbi:MAG TPA: long-chain fatty acid--CoA ligase [Devosiaceae bacterium]|nr:long-chain fatty acid--CoA ligase [Devosiaceae bacterium]
MTAQTAGEPIARPWLDHYPPGVRWDIAVDTTPVHEQVLAVCAKTPRAVALDFLGATTTFGALGRAINAFAAALQTEFGVKKGIRVALMLPNCPLYVVAYYSVLRAGGTVVNCNPLYTLGELTHIVSNAGADLLVTLDLVQLFSKAEALVAAGHVKRVIVGEFPSALPLAKSILFRIAKAKDIAKIKDSPAAGKVSFYSQLIQRAGTPASVAIDPLTDVAVQQYTGGTTGTPKGAMLSHANIAAQIAQVNEWAGDLFFAPSKVVAVLPFFHIFSMTACLNLPLCNGAATVMLPRFELRALIQLIGRTRANILLAVPTLLAALANAKDIGDKLQSLQISVSGGAGLPNEVREAFAKVSPVRLAEGYGLTEASPVVCCAALHVDSKPNSIGQPLPATDVRFADLEDPYKTVALGERGELLVKGPQVMLGYYNDEKATSEAFIDGYLRTGDVGYMDEDGYVFLVDRIKDLIICSGFNVYPRVIEDTLYLHEAVDEVTVIGVPDEYRGEAPVAFVKLKAGASASPQELREFASRHLNKLEIPREVIIKEQLPKTLIGKLSKKELREEYAATRASHK